VCYHVSSSRYLTPSICVPYAQSHSYAAEDVVIAGRRSIGVARSSREVSNAHVSANFGIEVVEALLRCTWDLSSNSKTTTIDARVTIVVGVCLIPCKIGNVRCKPVEICDRRAGF
jgi:hypothetical protein